MLHYSSLFFIDVSEFSNNFCLLMFNAHHNIDIIAWFEMPYYIILIRL